jgi:ketosteroid isomerase-like protein
MHPNGDIMTKGFAAFDAGDMATIAEILAPDIVWHASGNHVLSGEFHGQDEVFGYFAKLIEVTDGTFEQQVHAVLADDDHVVVLARTHWTTPRPFTGQNIYVWHVRDGRAVECWQVESDQAGVAAALA